MAANPTKNTVIRRYLTEHPALRPVIRRYGWTRCVLRVASGPREKLASCKSALNPTVVYSTYHSKAVAPVLVHFPHNQDPNIVPVIYLAVITKHLLLAPNLLVKRRIKIPYLNHFAIIVKRQVILFLNEYI